MRIIDVFVEIVADENGFHLKLLWQIIGGVEFEIIVMCIVNELQRLGWIARIGKGNDGDGSWG